jgi:hypothetical protein
MKTIFTLAFAAAVSFAGVAMAADPQTVVTGTDPHTVRKELVAAAEHVCQQARANDPFGDFGSQDECVEDTLDHVHTRYVPYQPQYTQRQANAAPIR